MSTYTAKNAEELKVLLEKDPVIGVTSEFKLHKLNVQWSDMYNRPMVTDQTDDYIMILSMSNIATFYSNITEYLQDNPGSLKVH